jgi:3-hydroxyisobutyrate dehydrogenase
MNKTPVGFIGLGVMGAPMAGHLARAGYPLTVFDINPVQAQSIHKDFPEARIGANPREVAAVSEIVITMLPSGTYVREVVLGDQGLVHGLRPGGLVLDTSSAEPWITAATAAALAERGIDMVDAPVSGARPGAERAELVFMAGGTPGALDRVRPLLEVMGRQIYHLGPVGSGHTMKCINNLITAMNFMASAEGLLIGKRAGLDPETMIDVINESTGMSWVSRTHFKQRIFNRAFDDAFKLDLMVKDIGIAMRIAGEQGLPIQLSETGQRLWREAQSATTKDASISEMVRWLEHLTGVELNAASKRL